MEKSETIGKLIGALAKVQMLVPTALKDSDNPYFKSKYADLAAYGAVAFPLLGKNELAVVQIPGPCADKEMSLYTLLGHSSGEWIGGESRIPLSKIDAQAYGSANTYARRYALGSFIGILTDDDDGNAAARPNDKAVANDAPKKRENWGGRFPNKTSLHKALSDVDRNLRGCGDIDMLEAYVGTDEYKDFVKIAGEHAPHYLTGGDPAPEEFVGIFQLEQSIRDELNQKEAA
jgi:hypothetical protein